jgi:hypothetical protein
MEQVVQIYTVSIAGFLSPDLTYLCLYKFVLGSVYTSWLIIRYIGLWGTPQYSEVY